MTNLNINFKKTLILLSLIGMIICEGCNSCNPPGKVEFKVINVFQPEGANYIEYKIEGYKKKTNGEYDTAAISIDPSDYKTYIKNIKINSSEKTLYFVNNKIYPCNKDIGSLGIVFEYKNKQANSTFNVQFALNGLKADKNAFCEECLMNINVHLERKSGTSHALIKTTDLPTNTELMVSTNGRNGIYKKIKEFDITGMTKYNVYVYNSKVDTTICPPIPANETGTKVPAPILDNKTKFDQTQVEKEIQNLLKNYLANPEDDKGSQELQNSLIKYSIIEKNNYSINNTKCKSYSDFTAKINTASSNSYTSNTVKYDVAKTTLTISISSNSNQ